MNDYLPEHLKVAHDYWKKLLLPSDNVIDATCGNGKDTLYLTSLIPQGNLFCYDIQKKAISNTLSLLKENQKDLKSIIFIHNSHKDFSDISTETSIKLVVYNLGYLPGGDKSITTLKETTTQSIEKALKLIIPGGAISITCYSGHEEGLKEKNAILKHIKLLDKKIFTISLHQWTKVNAPCLIWIQKKEI